MFVRPAPGLKVRRADTLALLPDAGEDVPDEAWCHRRLRDGDVLEGPATQPTAAAAAEAEQPAQDEPAKGEPAKDGAPYHLAETPKAVPAA